MSENYTLTREKALELLEKAVAEKGEDFVYTSPIADTRVCQYIDSSSNPSCIVGHVVKYLSDELGNQAVFLELGEHEGQSALDLVLPGVVFDSEAALALATAQEVQDSMEDTWGTALKRAREVG